MIDRTTDVIEKGRVNDVHNAEFIGQPLGEFVIKTPFNSHLFLIVQNHDAEWWAANFPLPAFEHVSVRVTTAERCPTWDEMKFVKDLFFKPEELVIQYHPPAAVYVNNQPHTLHLWRVVDVDIPLPPIICV